MPEAAKVIENPDQSGDGASDSAPPVVDSQLESKAREMGWVPKTEFRGDQTKWVDAAPYVKRGEELLPIVQASNRQLRSEVQNLRGRLAQSDQNTAELRTSIDDLKKFNTQIAKDRVKTTRTEIAKGIKQAREDGDVERELELQDQLEEASNALREAEKPITRQAPPPTTETTPVQAPEFQAWQTANPWFGTDGNERKTNYALAVARDLRAKRPELVGTRAFFDEVTKEVQEVFEPAQRRPASKVEGGNGSSRSGGTEETSEKTFADLPAAAQTMARSQSKRFVGPNKAFKTEAEWFSNYVTKYFE